MVHHCLPCSTQKLLRICIWKFQKLSFALLSFSPRMTSDFTATAFYLYQLDSNLAIKHLQIFAYISSNTSFNMKKCIHYLRLRSNLILLFTSHLLLKVLLIGKKSTSYYHLYKICYSNYCRYDFYHLFLKTAPAKSLDIALCLVLWPIIYHRLT